jgi:hypothetical protein
VLALGSARPTRAKAVTTTRTFAQAEETADRLVLLRLEDRVGLSLGSTPSVTACLTGASKADWMDAWNLGSAARASRPLSRSAWARVRLPAVTALEPERGCLCAEKGPAGSAAQ